jgi:uncharacterized protein
MSHPHSQYTVRYAGLAEGSHQFDFSLNRDFFLNYYPETEILDADINIHIEAEKTNSLFSLNLNISGCVTVECDRCLDPCSVQFKVNPALIFSSENERPHSGKNDDTVINISTETESIRLDEYLYDFIMLALPFRRVHDELDGEESACNHDMLARISNLAGEKITDPRWETLNKLKE